MSHGKFAVIGVGKYGATIARILAEKGAQVFALDNNEEKIENLKDDVAFAVTLDSTDKKVLISQNITDVDAVVLSEKAVQELQLDKPINSETGLGKVIGVISDVHSHSMHEKVKPLAILLKRDYIMNLVVKLDGNNNEKAINYIKKVWEHYAVIEPFAYNTVDEQISLLYPEEKTLKAIISAFTLLSVLLVVFGLFATSLLMAEQQSKEVGIRKVFGSSNWQIIYGFIAEFITLCIISLLIAIPASYYIMHNWLSSFAYKTQITFTDYFISIITSIAIIVFTVLYVSIKLSRLNPLEIIKYE